MDLSSPVSRKGRWAPTLVRMSLAFVRLVFASTTALWTSQAFASWS